MLVTGWKNDTKTPRAEDALLAPSVQNVHVEAGASTRVPDVKLMQPAIIEGQLVDAESGEPLRRKVTVQSYDAHWPRSMSGIYGGGSPGISDESGKFSIAVAPGDARIFAIPEDSYMQPDIVAQNEKNFGVSVQVKAGEKRHVDLRFSRGLTLRGSVRDENGRAAPGAKLTVGKSGGAMRYLPIGKNGDFSLDGLAAGDYRVGAQSYGSDVIWEIVGAIEDPTFAGTPAISVTLPQKESLQIVVRPRPFAKISGRVLAASGEPLAGVEVRFVVPVNANGVTYLSATSNAEGRFTLENIPTGQRAPVLQEAAKSGYRLQSGGTVAKNGDAFGAADIVMEKLSGVAVGRVLADGQPVSGALVFAPDDESNAARTFTGEGGHFTLNGLPPSGGAVMAAHGARFRRGELRAESGRKRRCAGIGNHSPRSADFATARRGARRRHRAGH